VIAATVKLAAAAAAGWALYRQHVQLADLESRGYEVDRQLDELFARVDAVNGRVADAHERLADVQGRQANDVGAAERVRIELGGRIRAVESREIERDKRINDLAGRHPVGWAALGSLEAGQLVAYRDAVHDETTPPQEGTA
jgi:hypothetical protein